MAFEQVPEIGNNLLHFPIKQMSCRAANNDEW